MKGTNLGHGELAKLTQPPLARDPGAITFPFDGKATRGQEETRESRCRSINGVQRSRRVMQTGRSHWRVRLTTEVGCGFPPEKHYSIDALGSPLYFSDPSRVQVLSLRFKPRWSLKQLYAQDFIILCTIQVLTPLKRIWSIRF